MTRPVLPTCFPAGQQQAVSSRKQVQCIACLTCLLFPSPAPWLQHGEQQAPVRRPLQQHPLGGHS